MSGIIKKKDILMNRRKPLYEGKVKTIYEGPEPGTLIQYFKDEATMGEERENSTVSGKGVLNNRISAHIMSKIEMVGVPTHFIRSLNMREQLVRQVDVVPIEVVVRNVASGDISKRLGIEEGAFFSQPLIEFYYKNDKLNDPLISEQHIFSFGWSDPFELEEIVFQSLRINDFLSGLFSAIGLKLIDFKVEFGRLYGEHDELYIILADEISPDNCTLWDSKTGKHMGKDISQDSSAELVEAYQEIAKRLGLIPQTGIIQGGNVNEQVAEGLDEIENELEKKRLLRSIKKPSGKNPRKNK